MKSSAGLELVYELLRHRIRKCVHGSLQLANEIERSFGLKKSNRYRMENHITVMGLEGVAIHVTLHDTAVVIDCLQRAGELRRGGEVTPTA